MRFVHTIVFVSVLCAMAGMAATAPTKSTAKKATTRVSSTAKATSKSTTKAPVSTAKKTPATSSHPAASHVTGKGTSHVAAKGKKAGPPAPRRQLAPTADRYKQIQQALVDKGYLKEEPTGVWDADSVAAMQRFQSDQKETPTGKITAASLIGLGLGAKSAGAPEAPALGGHPEAVAQPAPPPAAPQATSAPAASQ